LIILFLTSVSVFIVESSKNVKYTVIGSAIAMMGYCFYITYKKHLQRTKNEPMLLSSIYMAKKRKNIPSSKLKVSSENYEYSISFWMYISDWGYKYGSKKNIIDKNGSPTIMLDAHNPNLIIRHKVLNGKSEDVVVNNIKLQKWTHVFVVVKNRQISVFIDKVMTKGFILSGMPDLKKSRMEISSDGGFNGKLYALKYFNRAAEYDDVDREYRVNKRLLK
jgi:hypothetical protein